MAEQTNYNQKELTDNFLKQAIHSRASDIHFDPEANGLRVRFRIDGTLYTIRTLPKSVQDIVISRIKVLAKLDITERRIPQDARLELPLGDVIYNFRVSTFLTTHGEAIVLRTLTRGDAPLELEALGLSQTQLDAVNTLIHNPYGIILITGPNSSGKTTLLYSILRILNTEENNVVTIEDPVEFQLENIRQMETSEELGLTFAKSMRAVLRQDPDILMVGEIRDPTTAQMAFQTALSGRLVLSTFHTFDVPSLIMRLLEMEIPSSVLAHGTLGIISSRLIRKICSSCAAPYQPTPQEQAILDKATSSQTLQKGRGCDACHKSGYAGRIGVFETVPFDDGIRSHILEGQPTSALRKYLQEHRIQSLREAAIEKVTQGITTVEEVIRIIGTPT